MPATVTDPRRTSRNFKVYYGNLFDADEGVRHGRPRVRGQLWQRAAEQRSAFPRTRHGAAARAARAAALATSADADLTATGVGA